MTSALGRMRDLNAAASALRDADEIVSLAATALGEACPRGISLVFTRGGDVGARTFAAVAGGSLVPREKLARPKGPLWIVDTERVPSWQRDRWIEPMTAGVHGRDYFFGGRHPITPLFDSAGPDYGRMMVCARGRLVAWMGTYVPAKRRFSDQERDRLAAVSASINEALRLAAELDGGAGIPVLSARQSHIVDRLALGWTNKRIADDLDIAPATVKTVLERLFRRFGVANRTALVSAWHAHRSGGVG